MKRAFSGGCSLLILAALATPADARPDPRTMTCEKAQSLVNNAGRIVMTTGPNTFAEIVAASSACRVSMASPQTVATRDNPRCRIGFVCRPRTGGR
jgi:hypothetical protein